MIGLTLKDPAASGTSATLYTITPEVYGGNGIITPGAALQAAAGSNLAFQATPDAEHETDSWFVDELLSQNGENSFGLNNIQAAHLLQVTFVKLFDVTVTTGLNGSIEPSGTVVKRRASSIEFVATPGPGSSVDEWRVQGVLVQVGGNTYSLVDIQEDLTVHVTFVPTDGIVIYNEPAPNMAGVDWSLTDTGPGASGYLYSDRALITSGEPAHAWAGVSLFVPGLESSQSYRIEFEVKHNKPTELHDAFGSPSYGVFGPSHLTPVPAGDGWVVESFDFTTGITQDRVYFVVGAYDWPVTFYLRNVKVMTLPT